MGHIPLVSRMGELFGFDIVPTRTSAMIRPSARLAEPAETHCANDASYAHAPRYCR